MIELNLAGIFVWLANYFLHSSVILGACFVAIKLKCIAADRRGEWLLKTAVLASFFTASLQIYHPLSVDNIFQFQAFQVESVFESISPPANTAATTAASEIRPLRANHFTSEANEVDVTNEDNKNQGSANSIDLANNTWPFKMSLVSLLFFLYSITVVFLLAKRLISYSVFSSNLLRKKLDEKHTYVQILKELSRVACYGKPVTLSISKHIVSPLVLPKREIVLPEELSLDEGHIRAALAHELAHVVRSDTLWFWMLNIVRDIVFFQVLNRFVIAEINRIAEHRSDKLAVEWIGNKQKLAATIAMVAKKILRESSSSMALSMVKDKSSLVARVEALLVLPKAATSSHWLFQGVALIVALTILAPGIHSAADSVVEKLYLVESDAGNKQVAELNNHNLLSADGVSSALEQVARDNAAQQRQSEIRKKQTQDFLIRNESHGETDHDKANFLISALNMPKLTKMQYKQLFSSSATIVSDYELSRVLIRSAENMDTDLDVVEAFLSASLSIKSDLEIRRVLLVLLNLDGLNNDSYKALLFAAAKINSDFELAEFLIKGAEIIAGKSEDVLKAYFKTAAAINSDHELARVFLAAYPVMPEQGLHMLFDISGKAIQSDYELATLLIAVIKDLKYSENLIQAFLKSTESINSDYEMANTLMIASSYINNKVALQALMETASRNISSDRELTKLLLHISTRIKNDEKLINAYKHAARSISSLPQLNQVLLALRN